MKCQSLFSGKSKKNIISFSSTEFDQQVVKVKRNGHTFKGNNSVMTVITTLLTLGYS